VRLVARPSGAVSSGPTPLGLAVEGRAEGAVVIVTGLVPGMQLSAGGCAFFRSPANRRAAIQGFGRSAGLHEGIGLAQQALAPFDIVWRQPGSPAPTIGPAPLGCE
jgi:hypothetical protein